MSTAQYCNAALNKLTKWRTILAGWQLGTRSKDDPVAQAVRDHREATLIQRVELSAVTRLLIEKQVFTLEEYQTQLIVECAELEKGMEQRFPGAKATPDGMFIDPQVAAGWMAKFPQ